MNAIISPRAKGISRSEIRKIVRAETLKQISLTPFEVNLVIAMTLRDMGWGKKRIDRFIKSTGRIQEYFNGRYEDADLYAMNVKLKDIGVDVEELIKE